MDFKKEFGFEKNEIQTEMNNIILSEDEKPTFTYTLHSFTEKYKGKYLNNLTTNPNAKYYILKFKGMTYLQPHKPYVQGFEAITDENILEVVNNHISKLKNNHENALKFKKALISLKNKEVVK